MFGLGEVTAEGAIFKVNWNIPEEEAIRKKTEYLRDILASDTYEGDKETARSSLDFAQECLEQLKAPEGLRINVIYTTPGLREN
jgi:hypothetical protein